MIAVVILTWMVFWMRKVSRNVKVQLEQAVDNALQKGNNHGWALIMMVFFAVAREGLESLRDILSPGMLIAFTLLGLLPLATRRLFSRYLPSVKK